jgi:hypothetical protein
MTMGRNRLWTFVIAFLAAFLAFLTTGCLQEYTQGAQQQSQGSDQDSSGIDADSQTEEAEETIEQEGSIEGEEVDTEGVVGMVSSFLQIQAAFFSGVESLFSGEGSENRVSILNPKKSTGKEREAKLRPLFQGSCPEVVDRSKTLTEDPLYLILRWGEVEDEAWETCLTNKGLEMSGEMSLVLDVSDKSLDVTTTSLSFADYQVTADGSTKVQWKREGILGELVYNDSHVIQYPKGFLKGEEEESDEDEMAELSMDSEGTLGLTWGDGFKLEANSTAHSSVLGDLEIRTELDYLLKSCVFPVGTLEIQYQLDPAGIVSADILMTLDEDQCGLLTVQVNDKEPVEYDLMALLESYLSQS